jgi:hypothetical protein
MTIAIYLIIKILANIRSESVLHLSKDPIKILTRSATTAFRLLASPDNPAERQSKMKQKLVHISSSEPGVLVFFSQPMLTTDIIITNLSIKIMGLLIS